MEELTIAIPNGLTLSGAPEWRYEKMESPVASHTTPLTEARQIDVVFSLTFRVRENDNLYVIPTAGYIHLTLDPDLLNHTNHQQVVFRIVDNGPSSLLWRDRKLGEMTRAAALRMIPRVKTTFNNSDVSKTRNVRMVQEDEEWYFVIRDAEETSDTGIETEDTLEDHANALLAKLQTTESERSEKCRKRKFELWQNTIADMDDDHDEEEALRCIKEATCLANDEYPKNPKRVKLEEKLAEFHKIKSELSELIEEMEECVIPPDQQRLIFAGK